MLNRLKINFYAVVAIALTSAGYSEDLRVSVTPNPVFVGETAQYQIVSTIGKPIVKSFPEVDGINWNTSAPYASVQIVNFNRTDALTYQFTITKPGDYIIPSVELEVGTNTHRLKPVKITAQQRQFRNNNQTLTLDDLIFLKVSYDGAVDPPKKVYLGQEIELLIKLYVDSRLNIYTDTFDQSRSFANPDNYFPTLSLDNVVYRDYSAKNKHNSKFLYEEIPSEIMDNRRFRVFTYKTNISGIEIGKIEGVIEHNIPIIDPNRQRQQARRGFDDFFSFDDFFGSSRLSRSNRVFTHRVQENVPEISVLSVPSDKMKDGYYLGLIGTWNLELSVDRSTVSVGEDITLILEVQGVGNIAALSAPELELPGFRLYPPEINREQLRESHGTIKWVVIPLNTSSQFPKLTFTTFDPRSGNFDVHEFNLELKILEAKVQSKSAPIIEDYTEDSRDELVDTREIHRVTDILYIKTKLGPNSKLPLWKNVNILAGGLGVIGPASFLFSLLLSIRKERLDGSLSYRRRRDAVRNRRRIFREIKQSSPDSLPRVIRDELVPFLLAIYNLPPGATSTDLQDNIDDPELTEILKRAEIGGFMPGQRTEIDAQMLLKKVKNLLIIICCFCVYSTGICEDQMAAAALHYDQGNVEKAEEIYRDLLGSRPGNSELLYNLGNCAYRKGEYGKALVYYERARRLKPRDSDVIENLNFVRSQLSLPSIRTKNTPVDLIITFRDYLRPDEWLILAAVFWCMVWIIMAINRVKRERTIILPLVMAAGVLASLFSYWAQIRSLYSENQAIIIAQDTPIFRLPHQTDGGKAKFVLNVGDYVIIEEQRADWSRIRIDQDEGWVKNDVIDRIW